MGVSVKRVWNLMGRWKFLEVSGWYRQLYSAVNAPNATDVDRATEMLTSCGFHHSVGQCTAFVITVKGIALHLLPQ